jgi:hypothetical protein
MTLPAAFVWDTRQEHIYPEEDFWFLYRELNPLDNP